MIKENIRNVEEAFDEKKCWVRRHMREQNGIATLENHFLMQNYIEDSKSIQVMILILY